MKIFLDLATSDSPVCKVIKQIFTTAGELEFVPALQDADGIITDEPAKAEIYLQQTNKRVAQVLWWKQKPSTVPQSDRFKVFDAFSKGSLPGLIEAMTFLKGK